MIISMKNKLKRSVKALVNSISISVIAVGTALACAGGWTQEESLFSFFAPEVSRSQYTPFYRSYQLLYQTTGDHFSNIHLFDSTNVEDWFTAFGTKVQREDLGYILYKARLGEIDTLIFHLKDPKFPVKGSLKSNSILSIDDKVKGKDFLFYIGFARRCEKASAVETYWYWDDNDREKNKMSSEEILALISNGTKALERQKDTFIKERYIFQLCRLYFFAGKYEDMLRFAVKYSVSTANSVYPRIEGYKAASLYKLKRFSEANLIYARLFMMEEPHRTIGYMSFHPQEEEDWKQSLQLAGTNEKVALWALLGIYHDGLRAMKEIYRLDPSNELLDLLLVRAVRFQEESKNGQREAYYLDEQAAEDIKRSNLSELIGFVKSVKDNDKIRSPYLWEMSYGYLSFLNNDLKAGVLSFKKAKELAKADQQALNQIRLLELLVALQEFRPVDKKASEHIAQELRWIKSGAAGFYETQRQNIWDHGLLVLSSIYAQSGNKILAECFNPNPEQYYRTRESSADMIAFMDRSSKTEIEKLAQEIYPYRKENIFELDAIREVYAGNLEGALKIFNSYPKSGETVLPGDPFLIHINDCHDCDHQAIQPVKYTKHGFLKKVIEMMQEIQKGIKVAENSLMLGNAFYNITYFGNARVFYANSITASPYVDFEYDFSKPVQNDPVYDCSIAEKYYVNAMNASSDPEFKAKACFMASKCEQNKFYVYMPDNYAGNFKAGKYFGELYEKFKDTKYYSEILKECGYFRTYVNNR